MPDVPTTSETTVAGGPPPPPSELPPPAGAPAPELPASRKSVLLMALLALAGLSVGVVMTVLWLGVQGERDEAETDRDLAVEEREAARGARIATEAELAEVRTDLADTEAELAAAQAALASAEGAEPAGSGDAAQEIAALEAQVADLEVTVARLTEENEALQTALDEALAGDDATSSGDDVDGDEATVSPDQVDTTAAPNFARWIGELLTSRNGSSRLSTTQAICFGSAVIDDIGLEALGAGQNNAASGAERQVVIDAMLAAGVTCGIDPALIFN